MEESPLHQFELQNWIPISLGGLDISINKAVVFMWVVVSLAAVLMVPSTMSGVRNIAPIRIRAAESLGARRADIYLRIMLPDAFPFILTGLRLVLASAAG